MLRNVLSNHKEVIKLENISLSYGKRKILDNINISINSGEIAGLLGPNGVGKSTIFNLITGLIKPNNGEIFIKDERVNDFPIFLRRRGQVGRDGEWNPLPVPQGQPALT